ncbi:MAG: T9SS type A sorting domain-containing protein, partial [bacterium]
PDDQKSKVSLKIYDVSGRLVKSFYPVSVIQHQASGIVWSGDDDLGRRLPTGIYFVRLEAGTYRQTEKAILLR